MITFHHRLKGIFPHIIFQPIRDPFSPSLVFDFDFQYNLLESPLYLPAEV